VQDSHIGRQKAHRPDFRHVGGGLVIVENLAKLGLNLRLPIHLAAVESDDMGISSEERGEGVGIAFIPGTQQPPIQRTDLSLTRR
jgi:hypothetical protein